MNVHWVRFLPCSLVRVGDTLVDDLQQVGVLERRGHALLVVELLVDGGLARVRAGRDEDVDLEARGQRAQQLDAQAEPDECGHAVKKHESASEKRQACSQSGVPTCSAGWWA